MGLLNQVFQGNPTTLGTIAAGGSKIAPNVGIDTVNGALYESVGNGWQPLADVLAKSVISNQTAATQANLLTYNVSVSGLYRVDAVTIEATATTGTLPSVSAAYTDAELGTANTSQVVASGAGGGQGDSLSGSTIVNAQAGTTIVLSSAGALTLTYNIKTRIEFLG